MKAYLLLIAVGAVVLVWYDSSFCYLCDGAYELMVIVISPAAPRRVRCAPFITAEEARLVLEDKASREFEFQRNIDIEPYDGAPLFVRVPISYRGSPLGRKSGDFQFRAIALVIDHVDGTRSARVLRIPHRSRTRRIIVRDP